ncbi:hypothetical protein M5K25_012765 [Dendrobium thyrsiflorum]|uniref:Uncharacterized protein n=1 Tax=Dendrobium thyrsiflorum TaxID=117978 RepID=A0ABD0UYC6_DENTH
MVEKCVAPSKLHLKKELSVLQKARFLRDPETCSSWRSPLSSKSFVAYNLRHQNDIRDVSTAENISSGLLEIPPRSEKSRKRVYLYNWKNHSNKSSESAIKLNEDGNRLSVESSLEDCVNSSHKEEIEGDTYLLPVANICNVRDADLGTTRKSSKRLKKPAISNKRGIKHAAILEQRDLPSSPLGVLSSVEQSDDTGHCNNEDSQHVGLDLLCKSSHCSPSASSLFSGSGCANWPRPSKIFRSTRRDGSPHSCTPASTSSYYRHVNRKPSTTGSLGGTTASFEWDEFDQLDLPVRQGCGLPCYWSKRTKDRSCRGCYSPSLCDATRKMGGSICCRSQKMYNAKRSNGLDKPKHLPKSSQGMPLLNNNCDDTSSDELSTNLGERDLEALSRLDGRRWSNSKSQEAFEAAGPGSIALDIGDNQSLSVKYKPRTFDEIIGQNIVIQSLTNAVLKGKIAPAYLFQGPHGTGKTSVARIFSAALNCVATEGKKPCCLCKACTVSHGESGFFVREVSATNKMGIDKVRHLLKNMTMTSRLFQYRIFIIDECHLLTSKMWSSFLRFLEEPISHVVFIFITIDHENLPRAIISHCQKYQFSKIKDADVIRRLRKLSAAENLEVEMDSLNLIALNSDGSLQDAETMLYQASLLGKRITNSLVSDLVGVVSDEKLLDLLELAMSSKAEETVKRSRELIDSGVDPIVLVSQLAGLMMDIIAGTYQLAHSQYENVVLGGRSLTKDELKRLQQALKILSDAEKQLKQSSEHSSLLTTALLQLASGYNMESTQPNTIGMHTNEKIKENLKICSSDCHRSHSLLATRESSSALDPRKISEKSASDDFQKSLTMPKGHDPISNDVPAKVQSTKRRSSNKAHLDCNANGGLCNLSEIWRSCIGKCYSKTLRQLLSSHGKLISITENEGALIAFIAFADNSIKLRAERYLSSITNSLELVLKQNVEVTMGLVPDNWKSLEPPLDSLTIQHKEKLGFLDDPRKIIPDEIKDLRDKYGRTLSFPRKSRDASVGSCHTKGEKYCSLLVQDDGHPLEKYSVSADENNGSCTKEKGMEIAILKTHSQVCNEERLEDAWLQAAEKVASGLPNLSKTKKNQAIPQNIGSSQLYCDPLIANDKPSRHWDDEPNHEIKAPETNDLLVLHKAENGDDKNRCAISPSILHSNSFSTNFDKQNSEYESGPGCNGLFCWKSNRPHGRQVKQGTNLSSFKTHHMFGKRVKSKTGGNRSRR